MAYTLIGCLLVILASSSCSADNNLPTDNNLLTSTASCNQKKGFQHRKCFLTADCPACATTQVRCFDGVLLEQFYKRRFDDEFCGQHGIALVQLNSTTSPYLAPLECRDGMCPFGSQCLIGPTDGRSYCCSWGPTDNIRCTTLDLVKASRSRGQTLQHRVVDENGQPVSISRVSLVLQSSDLACIHGWSYAFRGDSVFLTNMCTVRFQVCYEPYRPALSDQLVGPGQICDTIHLLSRPSRPGVRIYKDSLGAPLNITSLTLLEQLSIHPCLEGESFNFSGSMVQASGGCRGLFSVCYTAERDPVTPAPTPVARECQQYTLKCKFRQHVSRKIVTKNKNPASVVSMRLVKQLSSAPCVEGTSFNFKDSQVFVSQGCQGRFEVCYLREQTTARTTSAAFVEGLTRVGSSVQTRSSTQSTSLAATSSAATAGTTSQATSKTSKTSEQTTRSTTILSTEPTSSITSESKTAPTTIVLTESTSTPTTIITTESTTTPTTIITAESTTTPTITITTESTTVSRTNSKSSNTLTPTESTTLSLNETTTLSPNETTTLSPNETTTLSPNETTTLSPNKTTTTLTSTARTTQEKTTERTTTIEQGVQCKEITLQGAGSNRVFSTFLDHQHGPVQVVSMWLVQQLSDVTCTKWVNFYFEGNTILAKNGCSGRFKVCILNRAPSILSPWPSNKGLSCRVITAYSVDNQPAKKSTTDFRGNQSALRSVQLLAQWSQTACVLGDTFRLSDSELVVSRGCGGLFRVCYECNENKKVTAGPREVCGKELTLLSTINTHQEMTIRDTNHRPVPISRVQLLDQFSEIECILGSSYNFVGSTFRVTDGCRGVFQVCHRTPETTTTSTVTTPTVTESAAVLEPGCKKVRLVSNYQRTLKKTFTDRNNQPMIIRSVRLLEQLSEEDCVEERNFRVSSSVVRVWNGCAGYFQVCLDTEEVTVTTTNKPKEPWEKDCETVYLLSTFYRPAQKLMTGSDGSPVKILSLTLVEQFSQHPCLESKTFFFFESTVTAIKGCRGSFEVCYDDGQDGKDDSDDVESIGAPKSNDKRSKRKHSEKIWRRRHDSGEKEVERIREDTDTYKERSEPSRSLKNQECLKLTIVSRDGRARALQMTGRDKKPVNVVSVSVHRQISRDPCIRGETFNFRGSNVWARDGCGAVFLICYQKKQDLEPREEEDCRTVKLFSSEDNLEKTTLNDQDGNLVTVVRMTLLAQSSDVTCAQGDTFDYEGSNVWVSEGCRGTFRVCYRSRRVPDDW